MCCNSTKKVSSEVIMENELQKKDSTDDHQTSLMLLELSATNDVIAFKHAIEEEGHDIDEIGSWYGRKIGSKKMGFEERTPLMIAAMFGSKDILNYILQTGQIDVNRVSGSDGATALHCAVAGGSLYSHEIIKLLIEFGADVNQVNSNGNRPVDVISPCFSISSRLKGKTLDILLNKGGNDDEKQSLISDNVDQTNSEDSSPKSSNDGNGSEKKEYPIDPSLPDINNGLYGTDEFRMFTFKVKPCSRAYSHDWTECPFVHPGENAKRRDPRKYHYSCVPCPEFRKGACPKGDACEYAHGIFECWLHPAQYRTRLCKDETNCSRRVCFFAHKPEELRPLYASTGSAVPSPRSSPTESWHNHLNITPPPALQLSGSRLKAALNARDMEFEAMFRHQQLLDELSGLSMSSPTRQSGFFDGYSDVGRLGGLKPNNLDDMFRSQSPTGMQMRQLYSTGMPSSPVRCGSPFRMEPCGSPLSNARLTSFANRSQSFIDRSTVNQMPPNLSNWGSPDGKVEWGVQGDELNKLRKSASFGLRSNDSNNGGNLNAAHVSWVEPKPELEPDVSWVQSLVKDAPSVNSAKLSLEEQLKRQYYLNNGQIPPWVEHEAMKA